MIPGDPKTITEWLQSLPIAWLVGRENGQADVGAYGSILDEQVGLLREAVKARFPDYGPVDALAHIGGDRVLFQEIDSDGEFRTRLRTAWDDWGRAGTPLEMLVQLYWAGFAGAVIIQQNGLAYSLSGAPTAGEDPTALLERTVLGFDPARNTNPNLEIVIEITTSGTLGTMTFTYAVNGGTPVAANSTAGDSFCFQVPGTITWVEFYDGSYVDNTTYTIATDGSVTKVGSGPIDVFQWSTPWWNIDGRDYFTSRFILLLTNFAGANWGTATFTGAENGDDVPWPTVTWLREFPDINYHIQCGIPLPDTGTGIITVSALSDTKTTTDVQIAASAPFVGTVDVIAWEDGSNPYADIPPASLALMRNVVQTWRPGETTPVSAIVIVQGAVYGWPPRYYGDGLLYGDSQTVVFDPVG